MSYFSEVKIVDRGTGQAAEVNSNGQLKVVLDGKVDDTNSSNTPLAGGAAFVGVAHETLDYGIIFISVYSDVASATNGLNIQQSCDGTNWDHNDVYTVPAATGKTFSVQPACKYFRVTYTNDVAAQTVFRLSTILKKTNSKPSSRRVRDPIISDDDGELVVAIIKGQNPAGTYVDFDATTQGNFKISLEELENGLSVNSNSQLKVTPFHSDGTAGALITGIDYVTGKSGIDASTETLQGIDYEHHEIHAGSHYFIADYALNQASGAVINLTVQTPDTAAWAHMIFEIGSSAGARIEIYEGTTGISAGAVLTPRNNHRNSTNTSGLTILQNPTIVSDGTRIAGFLAGGSKQPGIAERSRELVLKQNTTYLFRITSLAVSNDIAWAAEWYEHTNKN